MNTLLIYYLITLFYCMFFVIKKNLKRSEDNIIGVTPALDTIMVLAICWALAPVDLILRIKTLIKSKQ